MGKAIVRVGLVGAGASLPQRHMRRRLQRLFQARFELIPA